MPAAATLRAASSVPVNQDTREMDLLAWVSQLKETNENNVIDLCLNVRI